ncbi:MAG: site-specific integrase [Pseudonocardia sp.]|nr:site-specific integrase [Pseudonocardia sp.]
MSKPKSKVITVRVVGPLEPYAGQFRRLLAERGYAPLTRVAHLQVMTHLSKWMAARQLAVAELSVARVEEYLGQRRSNGYAAFCTRASLAPLLEVLAAAGAPLNEPDPPVSRVEALLDGYARFLLGERGLAASTTSAYVLRARRFLDGHGHGADLRAVDTAVVTRAVLGEAETLSAGSAQFFVVALRSFLRYCHLAGLIETDLSAASLPVTGRRRSVLPQGISTADARALLKACDRRTAAGRRDYAVILLLMRLGLRAREVAALRLEDIDWRAGTIIVRGKAARLDLLPLPAEVGEAIAAYLRHARPPEVALREVFVRSIAPRAGLTREAIGCLVRRASIRADLTPFGPHRLRHGLACDMVAAGVPLGQIGQVLRHADATSTSIYARVDIDHLRTVARSWPVGGTR